ncbi:penicillin-binding protein 2 [Deinococcus deserti]
MTASPVTVMTECGSYPSRQTMETKIKSRSIWMLLIGMFAFCFLAISYASVMAPLSPFETREGRKLPTPSGRGRILSADGRVLAATLVKDAGTFAQKETRVYPNGDMAGQLLGVMGASEGLEGLEHDYQDHLAAGQDLTLTIDTHLQAVTEAELQKKALEERAEYAAAIVMETRTGRLLAVASWPPSNPGKWKETPMRNRRNRAFIDRFEPGSVIKSLTVAAALDDGIIKPDQVLDTPMARYVGKRWGSTIRDSVAHGPRLTIQNVLRYSSNVGISHIVEPYTNEKFRARLSQFGIGTAPELPVVTASNGILRPIERWDTLVRTTNGFGQGMSTTLLQMAVAYNVLGNHGVYLPPRLNAADPVGTGRRVVRSETARTVREMLRMTIELGIPHRALLEGYDLGGKTGTAQFATAGGYSSEIYESTYAGFYPSTNPEITIAIMAHGARGEYHGADLAAPVYREIVASYASSRGHRPDPGLEAEQRVIQMDRNEGKYRDGTVDRAPMPSREELLKTTRAQGSAP